MGEKYKKQRENGTERGRKKETRYVKNQHREMERHSERHREA